MISDKKISVQTHVTVHQHPRILLGKKKRGFGVGKWFGFGGKVQRGESIRDAAIRELFEEAGIIPKDLEKFGIMHFDIDGSDTIIEGHFFRVEEFSGEPSESDEMRPEWFHVDDLPFDLMWPDDRHWMPLFLQRKKFKGRFLFAKSGEILKMELKEVGEI